MEEFLHSDLDVPIKQEPEEEDIPEEKPTGFAVIEGIYIPETKPEQFYEDDGDLFQTEPKPHKAAWKSPPPQFKCPFCRNYCGGDRLFETVKALNNHLIFHHLKSVEDLQCITVALNTSKEPELGPPRKLPTRKLRHTKGFPHVERAVRKVPAAATTVISETKIIYNRPKLSPLALIKRPLEMDGKLVKIKKTYSRSGRTSSN